MQALTFTKMAPMAGGRVDMRYRRVQCHPPSDLHVIVDQNRGAGGWIRLQVKVRCSAVSIAPICACGMHASPDMNV
jgi:hypothetical protein